MCYLQIGPKAGAASKPAAMSYKDAGVDIDAGNALVEVGPNIATGA